MSDLSHKLSLEDQALYWQDILVYGTAVCRDNADGTVTYIPFQEIRVNHPQQEQKEDL